MRLAILAAALLAAAAAVVIGVAMISPPAGWITGGVLFAAWTVALLTETEAAAEPAELGAGDPVEAL